MYSIRIGNVEIDTDVLNDIPDGFMKELSREIADRLRLHVQKSGKDVFNKKFKPYTKAYLEAKLAGTVDTRGRGPQSSQYQKKTPNLSLTGKTMNSLQPTNVTKMGFDLVFPEGISAGRKKKDLIQANAENKTNPRVITTKMQPLPVGINRYLINEVNKVIGKQLQKAVRLRRPVKDRSPL